MNAVQSRSLEGGTQPEQTHVQIIRHFGHVALLKKFPNTLHVNSSNAVSDPSMPMALRTYTRTPLNGVTTPQYFHESLDKGIW
ncbi:hypothetical protein AAFF_G00199520 [Aldrovandia affinis]|uniref:Uncharacterized protein n=1 Tax=Aldrovandia affinis TaxID=143900 RepID=A0AAD7R040_9TELE|nr:hypothetical protein AAFF_G00199520 [Aldrovandia affinis]